MTLNEIVPTYGNWGGPGWSAGERTLSGVEPNWNYGVRDGLDALFLQHDKAYWEAEQNPAQAAQIVLDADIALLRGIASGNWDVEGMYGALYVPLAAAAFAGKSLYDFAKLVVEKLDLFEDIENGGGGGGGGGTNTDGTSGTPTDGTSGTPTDGTSGIPTVNPSTNTDWNGAVNWTPPRVDPLVLDLDGDGIETLAVNATTHVVFDHDGDGLKIGTGWIAGDDGFLVLDRNANGTIDNGGELFGDQTLVNGIKAANGFAALSAQDTDADGTFDAVDANFTAVRIWQDTNSDGVSQASELHTLTELGIVSINLTSTTTAKVTNGNIQTMNNTIFNDTRKAA